MRAHLLPTIALGLAVTVHAAARADVKTVPYPEVKVKLSESYKPDAAFQKMQAAFAGAVAKKDAAALLALVGPTFVWTMNGALVDKFDMGRDAIHNFKVVFGFREYGKNADGGVEDGPFWDSLAAFADDKSYYKADEAGNLVCGPMSAEVADDDVLEKAGNRLASDDSEVNWYFTLGETAVAKAPNDKGPPVGKLGIAAVPVLKAFPESDDQSPTHLQVLLPSGKTGWIAASVARPLNGNRLCYAKTVSGDWKIANFDEAE